MDEQHLDEQSAWRFLQTEAMNMRVKVEDVAQQVIDGEIAPER